MWASWAFCKLVHISMPTPYLSIKRFKSRSDAHCDQGLLMGVAVSAQLYAVLVVSRLKLGV